MTSEVILISALIFFGFIILLYFIKSWFSEFSSKIKPSEELLSWLKSTNQRLDEQNKTIISSLHSSTRALNERLDNAARFIANVQKNIGEMSEIGRGMKELQDFLKSPKLRGNIGEQILKEILSQILPKQSFFLQYIFKSGVTVDAAIKTANGIIPVDSKFPLENFRRMLNLKDEAERKIVSRDFEKDVRKHIDDISKKYILPDEGTVDFALMYIPSEAVYYEIVNNPSLFDYAGTKRVLPVSPMTFYAFMRAILMSFEGQKIESRAKQILQTLKAMQRDYQKVDENLTILSRHINNAYNQMNNVLSGFTLLGQKINQTQSLDEEKTAEKLKSP